MPLFTSAQIQKIREIISRAHAGFAVSIFGAKIDPKMRASLERAGLIPKDAPKLIDDAYVYAQLIARSGDYNLMTATPESVIARLQANPQPPLSDIEKAAVETAARHAGEYCTGLASRVASTVIGKLTGLEASLTPDQIKDVIADKTAANRERRELTSTLKSDLGHEIQNWTRDWLRIATTETNDAIQEGIAATYEKDFGDDVYVSKLIRSDACPECRRFFVGDDGEPVVFKLSQLRANGTNIGKRKNAWRPTVGNVHPWCFPSDTVVLTARGEIPIGEVKLGDLVFTHKGRWRRVRRLYRRRFAGALVELGYGDKTLRTTSAHPLRVGGAWVPAGDIQEGAHLLHAAHVVPFAEADEPPPIRVEERFLATVFRGFVRGRVPVTAVNLDGELYLGVREVDEETADLKVWLRSMIGDAGLERAKERALEIAHHASGHGLGFADYFFFGALGPPPRLIRGEGVSLALLGGHSLVADLLRFTRTARCSTGLLDRRDDRTASYVQGARDRLDAHLHVEMHSTNDVRVESSVAAVLDGLPGFTKDAEDGHLADAEAVGDSLRGSKLSVEAHDLKGWKFDTSDHDHDLTFGCVAVNRKQAVSFDGIVFNLGVDEDESYVANGIAAHNCGCMTTVVPKGMRWEDGDLVVTKSAREPEDKLEKSYARCPKCAGWMKESSSDADEPCWECRNALKLAGTPYVRATEDAHPKIDAYSFQGIPIVVETMAGTQRHWGDKHKGQSTFNLVDYGFVEDTEGADGEEIDCYVGPDTRASHVYVVHQRKKLGPDRFEGHDEDKVMLGLSSEGEARRLYLAHYDDPRFLGSIDAVPVDRFKRILEKNKGKRLRLVKALGPGELYDLEKAPKLDTGPLVKRAPETRRRPLVKHNALTGYANLTGWSDLHLRPALTRPRILSIVQGADDVPRPSRTPGKDHIAEEMGLTAKGRKKRKKIDEDRKRARERLKQIRDVESLKQPGLLGIRPHDAAAAHVQAGTWTPALLRESRKQAAEDARKLGAHKRAWQTAHVEKVKAQGTRVSDITADIIRAQARNKDPNLVIGLNKAMTGPFIGPRGGKWADAAHTIPWEAPTGAPHFHEDDIVAARNYTDPGVREMHHAAKDSGDDAAIQKIAHEMAEHVPHNAVLVPMPGSHGRAGESMGDKLVRHLAKITGRPVHDVLRGKRRESIYGAKKEGKDPHGLDLGLRQRGKLPKGAVPYIVDNVVGTGTTARAALAAIPGARVLAHAIAHDVYAKDPKRPTAPAKRTGAIQVPNAQVREVADQLLDLTVDKRGQIRAHGQEKSTTTTVSTPNGRKLSVNVRLEHVTETDDVRGVSGQASLPVQVTEYPRAEKKADRVHGVVRHPEVTVKVRFYPGMDAEELKQQIRSVLSHELAHVSDPSLHAEKVAHAKQAHARHKAGVTNAYASGEGNSAQREGETKDQARLRYFNEKGEVTARIHQIVRDILDKKSAATIKQAFDDHQSDPAFPPPYRPEQVATWSPTWEHAERHLTPENRKRVLRAIASTVDGIHHGRLEHIEKARAPAEGPFDSAGEPLAKGQGPFIGPRGGRWADPEHTVPWHPDVDGEALRENAHPSVANHVELAAHRVAATGADPSKLGYLGAGMEGIVLEHAGRAYKVARRRGGSRLRNEAEALQSLQDSPVSHLVPKFHSYDREHDVIARENVEGKPGGWGSESKLKPAYMQIAAELRKRGFTAPEFKGDSFIIGPDGKPKLVDMGFVNPIGERLAKRLEERFADPAQVKAADPMDASIDIRHAYTQDRAISFAAAHRYLTALNEAHPGFEAQQRLDDLDYERRQLGDDPRVGDKVDIRAKNLYPFAAHVIADDGDTITVGQTVPEEGDKAPKHGVKMPKESFRHFVNDLNGRAPVPEGEDRDVNLVARNQAELLGKGDDGVVFRTGDNVVKMSTTVPYQPFNPGHLTPGAASKRLKEQVDTANAMADDGVPGIMRSRFVKQGDKGFQIKPYVDIPDKLSREQLDEVAASVNKAHEKGWVFGDEIQIGTLDGKPMHFDTGKAHRFEPDPKRPKHFGTEQDDDIASLKRLFEKHGEKYLTESEKQDPMAEWEALDDAKPESMSEDEKRAHRSKIMRHTSKVRAFIKNHPDHWAAGEGWFKDEEKRMMTRFAAKKPPA